MICSILAIIVCTMHQQCEEVQVNPVRFILLEDRVITKKGVTLLDIKEQDNTLIGVYKYQDLIFAGPAMCVKGGSI